MRDRKVPRIDEPSRADKRVEARERALSAEERLSSRNPVGKTPCPHYVVKGDGGAIERVMCKLCGAPIKDLVEEGKPYKVERGRGPNKVTVVHHKMVLRELANYTEILMEMDDGSAHATPLCIDCSGRIEKIDMEDLYCVDMGQAMRDEEAGEGEVYWELWADRIPLRVASRRG